MEYRITKHFHTRKHCTVFIVSLSEQVAREEFMRLLDLAKTKGGVYQRAWAGVPGGFAFDSSKLALDYVFDVGGVGINESEIVESQGYQALLLRAHEAGMAAGEACTPTPMHIRGYAPIADGVCGFAWISIHPATSSLVKYMREKGIGSKGYPKGWQIWVSAFGQSMERKQAYAMAYADVLKEAGFKAYAGSRMD